MATIRKKQLTRWYDAAGRRVSAGTPGARKATEYSSRYYGYGIPGHSRPVPLATDRKAAEAMLRDLIARAERGLAGLPDRAGVARPLCEHVERFAAACRDGGATDKQVRLKAGRVRRLIEACGFKVAADLDAEKVRAHLARMQREGELPPMPVGRDPLTRDQLAAATGFSVSGLHQVIRRHGLAAVGNARARRYPRATAEALRAIKLRGAGPQTANHYLREVRSFCRWLVEVGVLATNPMVKLKQYNVAADQRRARRALTGPELSAVLEATRGSGDVFRGLTGDDRYHLYLTASATGLREGELAALTPERFRLRASPPVVELPARSEKARRGATQPLPQGVADAMRAYLQGRPNGEPVWPGNWCDRGADMLRVDLAAAGVPYVVEGPDGPLYADFHSLRHTYVALLESAGVSLKHAMHLARHSDPKLTLKRYGKPHLEDLAREVERLPVVASGETLDLQTVAAWALVWGLALAASFGCLPGCTSESLRTSSDRRSVPRTAAKKWPG